MKKVILFFLCVIGILCVWAQCSTERSVNRQPEIDTVAETMPDSEAISDEVLLEIEALVDSMEKYGFKEGAKRFYKDSLDITDEELDRLQEMTPDLLNEVYAKRKH